jgi:hypothetical protein
MKYKIFEMFLNEYVNHPTHNLLDEVEANSPEEANRLARLRFPNKGVLKIGEQEFDR